MTLHVYTVKREIYIESEERKTCIKHHIPKRNKYFKEELRRFRAEIRNWLTGAKVDEILFEFPNEMTFHHKALYQAVVGATFRDDKLVTLIVVKEEEDVTDGSSGEHGNVVQLPRWDESPRIPL